MKLSDRLFHPDRSSQEISGEGLAAGEPSPESLPSQAHHGTLIAGICIYAGLAMIVLGVRNEKWLLVLLGPFVVWYGLAWVLVALEGRLPGGRLRLNPWDRG